MNDTMALACDLIRRPSITPEDAGCQDVLAARLAAMGFHIERLRFGMVDNLWARKGEQGPLLTFVGHTDVVPPGPLGQWQTPPFVPDVRDGLLYGRGAADMKGSIAAMITACERFIAAHPEHRGAISWLITSDEEAQAIDGTVKVVEHLKARGEQITWCLVGEPSSVQRLGDVMKNGRRGSLNGRLLLRGQQGHVAYPHLARNPIHPIGPLISALTDEVWDQGHPSFPPTAFQISNIHAGAGATNVIPSELELSFNFRFTPAVTVAELQERTRVIVEIALLNHEIKAGEVFQYDVEWQYSGLSYYTAPGALVEAAVAAIRAETGVEAELSTSGGTSDGRFIAPTGAQVIELGPLNATIHKVNECVAVEDLNTLSRIYEGILQRLCV